MSSSAANTVTLADIVASDKIAVTGTQNITIKADANDLDIANIANGITNGLTGGATLTVQLTAGAGGASNDLSKIAANVIDVASVQEDDALVLADGATVRLSKDNGAVDELALDMKEDDKTLNIIAADDQTTGILITDAKVVNLSAEDDVEITLLDSVDTATLKITGSKNITIGTAKLKAGSTVNASELTGDLDIGGIGDDNLVKIFGGTGDDKFTIADDANMTISGGEGSDTVVIADDLDFTAVTVAITAVETLDVEDEGVVFSHTQAAVMVDTGLTTVKGTTGSLTIDITDNNGATLTLSSVDVAGDLTGVVVTGGDGDDTITGSKGDDSITAGEGDDTINLSAGGSDTVIFSAAADNGEDTIVGFKGGLTSSGGDVLNFNAVLGTADIGDLTLTAASANQTISDDDIYVLTLNAAISGKDYADADFAEIFGAGVGKFATATNASNDVAVVIVKGTDVAKIYFVDASAGDDDLIEAGEVSLIGIMTSMTGTLATANFVEE